MAIALEEEIGNTTVRIHDDYCKDKTPEEVRAILRRIANYIQGEVAAAESRTQGSGDQAKSRAAMRGEKLPK